MTDYTIVNFQDLEDQAPKFGLSPGLDSRFARKPLALQKSGMSRFRIAPGFRAPFGHAHSEQEEVYVVTTGSARIRLDEETVDLKTWDAVRIGPGVMRAVEGGPEGCELLAFGAPNNENADVEMVQGWWSD